MPALVLADEERRELRRLAWPAAGPGPLALRSTIVLACAEGASNREVAARLAVTPQTVGKWRARFMAARLGGLSDEPRSGQPRKITDAKVAEVIARTLEQAPPRGSRCWSTRSMAKASGLSQTAVSRIWRAFGLRPRMRGADMPPTARRRGGHAHGSAQTPGWASGRRGGPAGRRGRAGR